MSFVYSVIVRHLPGLLIITEVTISKCSIILFKLGAAAAVTGGRYE